MAALTTFTDGTYTSAVVCGDLVPSTPIPGDPTAIIYSQDFMIFRANYAAPTLSAANATYATAYLIGDTNFQSIGGGLIRFTRQWATIPANRNEWGTKDYQFIGYITDNGVTPPFENFWDLPPGSGRDPDTQRVKQRMYHEYFLCAAGQTYTTPAAIPVVPAQEYYLLDNPQAKRVHLLPAGEYFSDTVPTTEDYLDMIADGDEIVSEASDLQRYAGEIYVRITPYIVAK